ncbi:MAG TPA: tRNA pseudouridine(13) synthase TruD [Spirochaetia bacterium]|nr:tRNA pseudouridine(13) synthase TruD [Spirochaetia bacterium]
MKVKARPEDFVVEEEADFPLSRSAASHAVFSLSKKSWDTFDLIDLLARRLGVRRDDISVGGMKDRHGATEQVVTVRGLRHPPRAVSEANFTLRFRGWSEKAISARAVRGNRFTITLRDIAANEIDRIGRNIDAVGRSGFPNYFDEQRFGSARHGAGFMGKEIFLGRRENALKLYFTPSKHDDRRTRALKTCVTESWGRWESCAERAFGEYARILTYLSASPRAYHQALQMIDRRFLLFVVNAYQSFLFNEILARWLKRLAADIGVALRPLRYPHGTWEFYEDLPPRVTAGLRSVKLPVPGYDSDLSNQGVRSIVEDVLSSEGISQSDLRVRQMHRLMVHGVERHAVVVPEDLRASAAERDDHDPEKMKMVLKFFLPRGSYATILLKRIGMAFPSRREDP